MFFLLLSFTFSVYPDVKIYGASQKEAVFTIYPDVIPKTVPTSEETKKLIAYEFIEDLEFPALPQKEN